MISNAVWYWFGAFIGFAIAWAVIGIIGWSWWLLPLNFATLGGGAWWSIRRELKQAEKAMHNPHISRNWL